MPDEILVYYQSKLPLSEASNLYYNDTNKPFGDRNTERANWKSEGSLHH